ncbi:hypothetical protein D4S03_04315 [bacterium]|nr:MAG: hypothetical protein D4S03_04315 [bacterium]
MKKIMILAMVMVFCLVGSLQAQQQMDEGVRGFNLLIQLGIKKLAEVKECPSGNGKSNFTIIDISPSWWKKQTQSTKRDVVNGAMLLGKAQKRVVIKGVYVANRVSWEWLAYGDQETGTIEIYK